VRVYRSNRVEVLADALAELLRRPAGDPMAPETVVVHSQAMERWLAMTLSERLGVCANVEFPFPEKVVLHAFSAVLGEPVEGLAAWTPERLQWSVLATLPQHLDDPQFGPLRAWLADAPARSVGRRQIQLAKRVARVFDRYVTFRPEMVRRWDIGQETSDEAGWQPRLWRALRQRIRTPHIADLALRFKSALSRPKPPALPGFGPRLCLFAMSTLPPFYMDVFGALARHVDTHVFVLAPSAEYWADTRSPGEIARMRDPEGEVQAPPLLASFGRVARDFQHLLVERLEGAEEEDRFVDPAAPTLLGTLQSDVVNLVSRGVPGDRHEPPAEIDPADDSLMLHACHGPMRQVEVLRDALLDLFARHPDLEPRDVVVMTPDIESYAPLIEAVFSDGRRGDGDDPGFPAVPFRIADRTLRRTNPVAEAFLRVLRLAGARLKASEVLDLLAMEPVRERFRIGIDDLPQVDAWVDAAGIRWGLDAAHRAAHGQPPYPENTWRNGLDRLLLGHALPGDGRLLYGGVLPHDEIEGSMTDLLGRFVDACETLFGHLQRLPARRTPAEWRDALGRLVADLLRDREGYYAQPVRDALALLADGAEAAGFRGTIDLDGVVTLLQGSLEAPSPIEGFFSGGVTFSAMVPMRSIPFRVVCLLGMDDGAFPRSTAKAAFDLAARSPRVGDRNAREDDRYLFLEALLAARDHVVVTYTGRDIRTNEALPPAVPVGELLDAAEAGFRLPDGGSVKRHLVVEHPLQPFSPRCFGAPAGGGRVPRPSFDRRFLSAARKLHAPRGSAPPFLRGGLPAPALEIVTLDELVRFFQGPVRFLLRERLGILLDEADPSREDREPIALDRLEEHGIGAELLRLGLDGLGPEAAFVPVRASGRLPPGVPGRLAYDDVVAQARPLVSRVEALMAAPRREPVEVDAEVAGMRLVGRVGGLRENGLLAWQYGKARARHRISLWLRHLALRIGDPRFDAPSRLVARAGDGGAATLVGARVPPADARGALEGLVRLYRAGQRAPLPFFPETSLAWAEALRAADDRGRARAAAERAWCSSERAPGEDADPYVRRALGTPAPRPYEAREFHELAVQVWSAWLHFSAEG
jgi:exodeoxyribonuclease V gamma subunit